MERLLTVSAAFCCILAVTACSERASVAAEYAPDAASGHAASPTPDQTAVTTLPETRIRVDADRLATLGQSESTDEPSAPADTDDASASESSELQGTVNLNEASLEDLMMLPGVGPAIAGRIADYRQQRDFKAPTDLKRVRGIGDKTYQNMAPYVRVTGPTTLSD